MLDAASYRSVGASNLERDRPAHARESDGECAGMRVGQCCASCHWTRSPWQPQCATCSVRFSSANSPHLLLLHALLLCGGGGGGGGAGFGDGGGDSDDWGE